MRGIDEDGDGCHVRLFLEGTKAQCLAADPSDADTVYVGLRETGIRKTTDGGATWHECELPEPGVFSLAVGPVDGAVYAGTEPSRLFRSDDGGDTLARARPLCSSFPHGRRGASLRDPGRRTCAGSPRARTTPTCSSSESSSAASCARPTAARRGTTIGRGRSRDVHSLAWHPHVQGRAYEAGGGGSAWSDDGGDTWHRADDGRDRNYTWSVAVDPGDPDCWYVSASTGPFAAHGGRDPQARIYRRRGDEPWQALNGGLPEPLPAMPYALVASEQRLFAGLANGTLWQSDDRGDTWRACALDGDALPAINALALTAES